MGQGKCRSLSFRLMKLRHRSACERPLLNNSHRINSLQCIAVRLFCSARPSKDVSPKRGGARFIVFTNARFLAALALASFLASRLVHK